jgi:hypothetical protein
MSLHRWRQTGVGQAQRERDLLNALLKEIKSRLIDEATRAQSVCWSKDQV